MRVLVTGGAGFIGSHIVDALRASGHEPGILDNMSTGVEENVPDGVPLYRVDCQDEVGVKAAFDEFEPNAVCHQAAQMSVSRSVREPKFDAECNILGMLEILQNAHRVGCERFVFASSGGVLYGDVHEPAPETTPSNPISPYGISKMVGEEYMKFFAREHGLKGVAMRYANVYGPRQNPHGEAGVVAIFCKMLLAGDVPTINGDGKYIRDYVYGPDVAQANLLALTKPLESDFESYNVGTSTPTDVNDLAGHLVALVRERGIDVPEPKHGPDRPGDLRSSLVDYSKITAGLGWTPSMNVGEGLKNTVDWFANR